MIRINLLKPERKEPTPEEVEKKKIAVSPKLIILLFFVAAVALFFQQRSAISKENTLLNKAQEEKAKYRDVLVKLEQVEKQKSLFTKKIELISQLKSDQRVAVNIMDELSKNIPYWVWLTEATYDKQQVRIKGKAQSNTLVADYIYNLESSPCFSDVNLISTTQRSTRGNQFVDFSLTAKYVSPPALESPSEKDTKKEKK